MRLMTFHVHATQIKGKELTDAGALSMAPNEQPTTMDELAENRIYTQIRIHTQQYSTEQNFTNRDRVYL